MNSEHFKTKCVIVEELKTTIAAFFIVVVQLEV